MSRGLSSLPGCKKKEGNVMLQGRKGKGMCAVLLMLVMCFGPVPAEAQAEGGAARQCKAVHGGIYGKRHPLAGLDLYHTGLKALHRPWRPLPDHLGELGGDYEKLPQPQAEGTVLTVAYRTKVRLASALVVKSDYYNGDGALAGTVVQEYEAPAGERAVIDYLEGSLEGIEYIPVRLVLQATPFADSDSTDETRLGPHRQYLLRGRRPLFAAGAALNKDSPGRRARWPVKTMPFRLWPPARLRLRCSRLPIRCR